MDAVAELTKEMSQEEILREAIARGTIDMNEISASVNELKRKDALSQHPRDIWQNDKGEFLTYIYDEEGKRKIRRRKTREELEDFLAHYYSDKETQIYLEDIFAAWSSEKLKYGEIQKQSYDRYSNDYRRFFKKSLPICRKKVKNITEEDLETFIRDTIVEKKLSKKGYSSLVTLLKGMFRYGKKKGYTNISITQFIGDLEIPKTAFQTVVHPKEKETFSEDEQPVIRGYLLEHADIWNLGLMLQFQTGLRIGEIAALKPEDIGKNCIHVRRTEYKYRDEDGTWKAGTKELPKTEAGFRDVILPPQAHGTLEKVLELNPHGEFLFINKGKRIRENTFNKRLTDICSKLGIVHHSTHKIRKTYGTALLDGDVDESFVAEQMGHKDVNTTRKLYYYSNKREKTKIDQIANAISF